MINESVVVLGGGGIWGAAWMTGIIMGLAERGIDLTQASAFIGTSAGSIVGCQAAHGYSPIELFKRQVEPARQPSQDLQQNSGLAQLMELIQRQWESPEARTRAIADLALKTETNGAPESQAEISERLGVPSNVWPARALSITAIDAATCEVCVFNAQSGVGLIDAVAASCAVPGVRRPIPIKGRLYMDGGVWRNPENAHLALGERWVVIISPFGARMPAVPQSLHSDIEELRRSGSRVVLIAADTEALSTLSVVGPLDTSTRVPAAEAGRAQAHREAVNIRAWLG
jgi:NTE family protein